MGAGRTTLTSAGLAGVAAHGLCSKSSHDRQDATGEGTRRFFFFLVRSLYFSACEYKIVTLGETGNKHES